jgi:hypothetical protein
VSPRTRVVLLLAFGLAWVLLGAVNLGKGRTGIGVLYLCLGLVLCLAAAITRRAARRR